jgi:CheY-like chemotaxis protein
VFRAVNKPILIVAPDDLWRSSFAARLQQEGYIVLLARDRPEAVARMTAAAPGALFVDLTMPARQGQQLMAHLDRHPHLRMVPRLVALDGLKRNRQPISGGAVFVKPLDPEHLVRVLRFLCPPPSDAPPAPRPPHPRINDVWDEGLAAALAP